MTEKEMLVTACEKLGWHLMETEEKAMYWPGGIQTRKCKKWFSKEITSNPFLMGGLGESELPDLLHSLDAHFGVGGTVEWMRAKGHGFWLSNGSGGTWYASFAELHSSIRRPEQAPNPAMAILKAFLQHQPKDSK